MIELKNVCAGYSGDPVLQDISVTFPKGKVTVIVGPNGCGKSTLLKSIIRINPHTSGSILAEGTDISELTSQELARKVTYMAQNRQIPVITAMQMTLHGRFPYLSYPRRYRPQDREIAENCLKQLGILDLKNVSMSTMSGGQRQKVYIAMALAQDTPVVLMDEPTTFLDVSHQLQTMKQARIMANCGKTVVMVLHDLPLAMQTADYLAVMDKGKLAQFGTPEEVFLDTQLDRIFGITLCRFQTTNGWKYYYDTNP